MGLFCDSVVIGIIAPSIRSPLACYERGSLQMIVGRAAFSWGIMTTALRVTVVLVATVALSAASAEECSRTEIASAKAHFNAGAKAFRLGELTRAADEFKAAYSDCPSSLILYNLQALKSPLASSDHALTRRISIDIGSWR
jgi:hypothetical protein